MAALVCVFVCLCIGNGIFGQQFAPIVEPEQIHLSYGANPTEMTVTWSTMNMTQSSMVEYGPGSLSQTAQGTSTKFVDPGTDNHTQYIHSVTMTGLKPGQPYVYKVGSKPENVWSDPYPFTAMKSGSDWSPRIALYGDFGLINPQSLKRLMIDETAHMYDAIFHVGDFAYDMINEGGRRGDKFLNLIQPLAAKLPYMTAPGNHESAYNFTHYKNRFFMPGDPLGDRMFYSFDVGPVHFISFSTEYLFFIQYGLLQIVHQYEWLEADLKEATKKENRAQRPWIITMAHRPMYCSNNDKDDCTKTGSIVREGVPLIHTFGLEKLFWKYGVDLLFWAHEHSYERLWPVFNEKVHNGSREAPYTNPNAPVHIVTGSAGCQERHDPFLNHTANWSAFRSDDYGYARMQVFNSSHLYVEQVSDDQDGKVIDNIWLIKDKHGPYQ